MSNIVFKGAIIMNRILILVIITLCLFIPLTYAHSGRTDANGGHYDHATGTYH